MPKVTQPCVGHQAECFAWFISFHAYNRFIKQSFYFIQRATEAQRDEVTCQRSPREPDAESRFKPICLCESKGSSFPYAHWGRKPPTRGRHIQRDLKSEWEGR